MPPKMKSAAIEGGTRTERSHRRPSLPHITASEPSLTAPRGFRQAAGNFAVQRLLRTHRIQAKLTVNPPGDAYEQEADRVAEQVMRVPSRLGAPLIQRRCATCEEDVQRQAEDEEEEPVQATHSVARKVEPAGLPPGVGGKQRPTAGFERQLRERNGRGSPLPQRTLNLMNSALGVDFSHVRVHANGQAAAMSEDIQARAFTHKSDIYFNAGQYNPDTPSGTRLLAHELTHVVQQSGGSNRIQREAKAASGTCTLEGASFDRKGIFNEKTQAQVLNQVPKKLYRPPAKPCTANRAECDLDKAETDYILEKDTPVSLGPRGGYGDLFQSVCFTFEGKTRPEIYWVHKDYISQPSTEATQKPAAATAPGISLPAIPSPEFEAFRGDAVDKTGKISAPAIHYADAAATGMNVRAQPDPSADVITKIKYNETVFVKAKNKGASAKLGTWVFVLALDGRSGWINENFVATDMPEPNADLHHVTEPTLTTVLKNRYKGYEFSSPDDLRVLSAAVLVANRGRRGLKVDLEKYKESLEENWFKNLVDPWNTVNRAIYQSSEILQGHNIWLPSNEYIQQLKAQGIVVTRPEFVDAIIDFGKAYIGFQLGILEGFFGSIWEALEGIWELGKTLIETVGKIITGEILNDIVGLYESLKDLTWAQVQEIGSAILSSVGEWWEEIKRKWNAAGVFDKARMIGRVVGAIALEVLLAIFTGGGANAVKWIGKLGKIAPKLVKVLKRAIGLAEKAVPDNLKSIKRKDADLKDDSDSSTVDWYKALVLAKAIAETHDQKDTPVPLLMASLTPLVTKFKPVTGYKANPTRAGHYTIIQTAKKDDVVDPDYTVRVVSWRTRPSANDSEIFTHQWLETSAAATDWETQVRFLNGKRIKPDSLRKDSTKPDSYSESLKLAAEVKNYDLGMNYHGMIAEIKKQHSGRIISLPKGTRSWLFVDIRGQALSDYAGLARRIKRDVGGRSLFEKLHLITDDGVKAY